MGSWTLLSSLVSSKWHVPMVPPSSAWPSWAARAESVFVVGPGLMLMRPAETSAHILIKPRLPLRVFFS